MPDGSLNIWNINQHNSRTGVLEKIKSVLAQVSKLSIVIG